MSTTVAVAAALSLAGGGAERIGVFTVSGTLAAVGGLFVASRLTSASQVPGSGMLEVGSPVQFLITGGVLYTAVVLDSLTRHTATADGRT